MADFIDDIPEARRETLVTEDEPTQKSTSSSWVPWLLMVLVVFGIGGAGIWWLNASGAATSITSTDPSAPPETAPPATAPVSADSSANSADTSDDAAAVASTATATPVSDETAQSNSLLGHRPYDVTDESELITISTNPTVRLKPDVAQKVETMMAEAGAVGISLDVISGFRSLEDQQYLFFDLKAERGQTTQTRAEVSAPPGYSEHHTGYAVDFIDLSQPASDLSAAFENTEAFRWLEANAAYYGFEMSFPKGNDQDVAYEPWHWRYVGNQESLEMFYQNSN